MGCNTVLWCLLRMICGVVLQMDVVWLAKSRCYAVDVFVRVLCPMPLWCCVVKVDWDVVLCGVYCVVS